MILHANAKINFGLFVTAKRPDGYHTLESIFLPVSLSDVIEIAPSSVPGIKLGQYGIAVEGSPESNILVKAYHLLSRDFSLPGIQVNLLKNIPTGAGLGGGSSDGAFMIKALNEIFNLKIGRTELLNYAALLGSDCPFFIDNAPAFVTGRGEILETLSAHVFKGIHVVLVNPGVHISTAEAYSRIRPAAAKYNLREIGGLDKSEWQKYVSNDFEAALVGDYPVISNLLESLKNMGAYYVSMSGSGSSVYGFFHELPKDLRPVEDYFHRCLQVL